MPTHSELHRRTDMEHHVGDELTGEQLGDVGDALQVPGLQHVAEELAARRAAETSFSSSSVTIVASETTIATAP